MTTFPLRYLEEDLLKLNYEYQYQEAYPTCMMLLSIYSNPRRPNLCLEEETMQVHYCKEVS